MPDLSARRRLSPLHRRAWRWALGALALLLAGTPLLAAPRPARLAGAWVFQGGPSFPGVRMLRIEEDASGPKGEITTEWYGALPMLDLRLEGASASFELHNGNPRLPRKPWTATLASGRLKLVGEIWEQHVDVVGRQATAAEIARLTFHPVPLPALSPIPADGLARTPPMGWSSWNRFADKIDDVTVRQVADAIVSSGLRDAGYVYVNIDDGWQGERGADGVLRPSARFPDMKALADYLHARGLKLGLYSSPGLKTCAGYTGSYGHVEQDARTWAAWGVDYVKYDLCSGEGLYRTADEVRRAYQQMGAALKATGRPIVYSLCQYGRDNVGRWGRSVGGHLWRTTGDIADDYATMAGIGFDKNGRAEDAGPGGWNDPDMLEVGNGGMAEDEYRTHVTLWAISAAPLMMGHDPRTMSPSTLMLLENRGVIAVDQDALGRQGRRVRKDGEAEIWAKPLADGSVALGLFNRGDAARQVSFTPADAGLPAIGASYEVWAQAPQNPQVRTFQVPPHGAVLLRLSPR